ncbi:DUF2269 family protein [Cohnella nanjingensis]|uniref:DUF2269 family protein n=1 Tax=Cohnella nanjingensis TaxID=1387779 RepID=A0A7X0RNW5_9BACL|nr:DUF2269 family protein [Cohnella nanjingensis]MBB6669529.1 DUF2269 family protein [Cohnella nanjingensis]
MYPYLVLIHILSAVTALCAIIGYPIIMSGVRTAGQARFGLTLQKKMAILPMIGGTLLLLSGLALGVLEPDLFRQLWYGLSIVVFFVILLILAVLIPAGVKRQLEHLAIAGGDALPEAYLQSRRRSAWLEGAANLAALVSILLMVFKPM